MSDHNARSYQNDLVCLCHLRWDFVYQRPQHLMSRFAKERRVFFIEEPVYGHAPAPALESRICPRTGVHVITPHLPEHMRADASAVVAKLLRALLQDHQMRSHIAWFYTPMALEFASDALSPELTIYDCMDELSLFRGAPPDLCAREQTLLKNADLVFTGGASLFEAKRNSHPHVYAFPSGVDVDHFAQARSMEDDAEEHGKVLRPRLGYAGVIDERIDLDLIRELARSRPEWQLVMVGPVVKIDPSTLPQAPNIHWLGMKSYHSLPKFFAGWDVAIMPFALNDATRFISPTKTPEFLAAGLPVVSTPIRDVMQPYGEFGLARIASNLEAFLIAVEEALTYGMSLKWRERADAFLQTLSWDRTWCAMNELIMDRLESRKGPASAGFPAQRGKGAAGV